MKKGFTLIELLAVIVILAIIALIATPIILGIINDAREQAKHRTAELVSKEIELAYTSYLFDNNGSGDADSFCTYMTEEYFAMDNGEIEETCTSNSVIVKSGNDTYTVNYDNGTVKVLYGTEEYAQVTLKVENGSTYTQVYKPQYYGDYSFTGTVGETSAPTSPSTEPPAGKNFYLGYDVSGGKISAAYACFKRNGNEYCLKGYDEDSYTTNVEIIKDAYKEVVDTDACSSDDDYLNCDADGLFAQASSGRYVYASDDYWDCHVGGYGYFECVEL